MTVQGVRYVMILATTWLIAGAALAAGAATADPRTQPEHVSGQTGPGSLYEIDVPADWNGDLVLYAHGIVQADRPVAAPTTQDRFDQLRAELLDLHYAVAASSYSANGWALKDAAQRTHQLLGLFTSKVGRPGRVFLVGHSLGGLVVTKLAERYPGQFDGALAICAPLGGALAEIEYAGNLRVLFDHYFPGVLPGTPFDVPLGTSYVSPLEPGGPSTLFNQVFSVLVGALQNDPSRLMQWVTAAGIPYDPARFPQSLLEAALYVIGFQLRYTNDFIERVNGQIPYDNTAAEYQVHVADPGTNAYLSGLLNAGVARIEGDRAAFEYYEHNYEPSGDIAFPFVTLHGVYDPAVPFFHETMFLEKIRAAGGIEWLLQRSSTSGSGHCSFTVQETLQAFVDLKEWVDSGVKPQ